MISKIKNLLLSKTAKDTFVLFVGNIGSAFWGFLFTLIVARALSISDFGIFSATLNFMVMYLHPQQALKILKNLNQEIIYI